MAGGMVGSPSPKTPGDTVEMVSAQSLLDWSESGWLDTPEIARLGVLFNSPVVIKSSLPSVEDDDFAEWELSPGLFTVDVLRRVEDHGFRATAWLIGPRAGVVLGDEDLEEATPLPRSSAASSDDGDGDGGEKDSENADLVESSPEPQHPRGALQVRQTRVRVAITSSCPRDDLGDIRDLVLQSIRAASRGGIAKSTENSDSDDVDEVPDHMLAGAYLRQMMVVEEPGSGDGTHTAIFTFASFDERPEVFTLEFQACARGVDAGGALTGSLAALVNHDRIRMDTETMQWLHAHSAILDNMAARMEGCPHPKMLARDSGLSDSPRHSPHSSPQNSPYQSPTSSLLADERPDQTDCQIEAVELPSILFCRRQLDHRDAAEGKGEGFFDQMGIAAAISGIAMCFAACFGVKRHTAVSPEPHCLPPPPPPPLLVHEI